jgi:gliding motility-associated-like protein
MVCGNSNFIDLEANGVGDILEINASNACFSGEHNTIWLKILIKNGGTLGFDLTPASPDLGVDFDFWIFGPDATCGSLGTAIRCSTTNPINAGLTYNTTGMNEQASGTAEGLGADGDGYIHWMEVQDNETYYVIVDRPHGDGNFSIAWTGTATFHDLPVFNNPDNIPLDMVHCDDDALDDGSYAFNLTAHAQMFIGSQTFVALTYHTNSNDVTTGEDPIANPAQYYNTQNLQTIYVRMTNTITGCFATESFTIGIPPPLPAGTPQPLTMCDTNSNGHQVFNLALNNIAVINNQPGCAVTYYNTLQNAQAGTSPIGPLYLNQVAFQETVYARLAQTNGCHGYDIKSFTITVTPLPHFDNPANINLNLTDCDDDGIDDQSTAFNLTTHQALFAGSQQGLTFSYHTTAADAATGNNAIQTPQAFANTVNPQTVYVRAVEGNNGCAAYRSFSIEVINPVIAGSPPNIATCDADADGFETAILTLNNSAIQNGNTSAAVTYYTSLANAQNEVSPITTLQATYTPQTVWARLENTTGCFGHDITSFTIITAPVPVFNNPQNIDLNQKKCDDDGINDNTTAFNLTLHQALFVGTQTGVQVTYHTTQQAAEAGLPAIGTPVAYYNTSPLQTIYVRIANVAGCYVLHTFTIELEKPLIPGTPINFVLCDDNKNGLNVFDLSPNTPLILGNTPDATVTYYDNLTNAQNGTSPIPLQYQNQIPYGPQTIYARLQSNAGCQGYYIKVFTIKVQALPAFQNPGSINIDLTDCDDYGPDDASTLFNLTMHQPMFAGIQANTLYSYHTNAIDAGTGSNAIQTPQAYANTANPQTIYLRAHNTLTGCQNIMPFTLTVINPVVPASPAVVVLCDTDADGSEMANLSLYNADIQNGNTTAAVTYYNTQADAENKTSAITSYLATYIPQTIWVRLENTTGCYGYGITSFTLAAAPLPVFSNPLNVDVNLKKCDDDAITNNATAFDLTQHEAFFTGNQPDVTITYHTTLATAEAGTGAIGTPAAYVNTSVLQTIYVRLANAAGCHNVYSFTIEILHPLFPGLPADIILCGDSKTGFELFDLTVNDAPIIGTTTNAVVTYYTSQQDAINQVNPIIGPYQNQWGYVQQIIWARLEGTAGCTGFNIVAFTIKVQRLPQFINPQNIALSMQHCDDDGVNDQSTTFNLTTNTTMLLGNQPGMVVTYHTDAAEAALGTNAMLTPDAFANTVNPQTVYIRMYSPVTGCYNVQPFDVEVINPFKAGDPADLSLCDILENGHQLFVLSQNTEAIKNGQPDTQVSYYASQQDAQAGTNPLNDGYTNQQPYTTQTIWARLDSTSGCFGFDITSFTISVLPLPAAEYTINIADFTLNHNVITVAMGNNTADFEFAINGSQYSDNNTFTGLEPGVYTVRIRSKDGCRVIEEQVVILNYPKFFTPNGDGSNEFWTISYLSFFPGAKVNIFDRYGKLVKSYWGSDPGWDGTYNGHNLLATDYWFALEMEGGRTVRGHFSLLR